MLRPISSRLLAAVFLSAGYACVSAAPAASAASGSRDGEYLILFGSTHAHTKVTWSHGEQWVAGNSEEKKEKGGLKVSPEGVQSPPASGKLKPEWQKNQGTAGDHFARAKAKGYDFYTVADHSQEAPLNPPSPQNPAWVEMQQHARAATDTRFVALRGYEHSENNGPNGAGHINVINSAEYRNALAPGMDLPAFYRWLQTAAPAGEGPVVASFNHPSPKQYNEWGYRDAGVTEIIALLEVINSNKNIHYAGFIAALDHGWKVSPVCGNDNHGFYGLEHHTSRTGVLATARTQAAILDALRHRRTYATLEQNLQCSYRVNGTIMGSTLARSEKLEFVIRVQDPDTGEARDKVTKIDIVTEAGAVVESFAPSAAHDVTWRATVHDASKKYYFVRVWNAGGGDLANPKPDQPVAWLAPVWTGR